MAPKSHYSGGSGCHACDALNKNNTSTLKQGGASADLYGPSKMAGGSAIDDIFSKIKKGGSSMQKPVQNVRGGGLVDDLSKLAVPLGLIAAKEGVEYLSNRRSSKKNSVGGGLVEDMTNLAIPLGFVAAERVLRSQLSKRDNKKKDSSTSTTTKKKASAPKRKGSKGRMAAYGGDGAYGSDAAMLQSGGYADLMPLTSGGSDNFFDTIAHTLPKKGGSDDSESIVPKSMGGSKRATRSLGGGDAAMLQSGGYADLMPLTSGGSDNFFDTIAHTLPKKGGSDDSKSIVPKSMGGSKRATRSLGGGDAEKPYRSTGSSDFDKPVKGGAKLRSKGGADMAKRHAAIAAEFRKMASEIGKFLENKK